MKGKLRGHFKKEVRTVVVNAIKIAIESGLTQEKACEIFEIKPRKFRRWSNPKPNKERTAWNKILPKERTAIINTALKKEFWDKPMSHLFVYGHESNKFYVSISTIQRVLKSESLERNIIRRHKTTSYVDAHTLLEKGFSLLCYDATQFVTESNIIVWAIPVILLPCRYCLHIGYSLKSVTSKDLTNAIDEAYLKIPKDILEMMTAHSDRGSAMKSQHTKNHMVNKLNIPVHYGRPNTPDDEGWIEAFIKTLKYHRDIPLGFKQVADVIAWLRIFPDIYNNDPHSSLRYVTPTQVLLGKMDSILAERKQNLLNARSNRLKHFHNSKKGLIIKIKRNRKTIIKSQKLNFAVA